MSQSILNEPDTLNRESDGAFLFRNGEHQAYLSKHQAIQVTGFSTPFITRRPLQDVPWTNGQVPSGIEIVLRHVNVRTAWRPQFGSMAAFGIPMWAANKLRQAIHPLARDNYIIGQFISFLALGGNVAQLRNILEMENVFPVVLPSRHHNQPTIYFGCWVDSLLAKDPPHSMMTLIQLAGGGDIPSGRLLAVALPQVHDPLLDYGVVPPNVLRDWRYCLICGNATEPQSHRTRFVLDGIVVVESGKTVCETCQNRTGYTTISHVWGHTSPFKTFLVSWKVPLRTREKLLQLLHYGLEQKSLTWVDVVCINQDDHPDKCAQVSHMGNIFRHCNHCVVHVENVSNHRQLFGLAKKHAMTRYGSPKDSAIAQLSREHALSITQAVSRTMSDQWFKRVWTLQECLLPPSIQFVGADGQNGATIEDIVCGGFIAMGYPDRSVDPTGVGWDAAKLGGETSWETEGAAYVLNLVGQRQCSVAADKVYGILGLLPWGNKVTVNYHLFPKVRQMDFIAVALAHGDNSILHFTGDQLSAGSPLPLLNDPSSVIWLSRPTPTLSFRMTTLGLKLPPCRTSKVTHVYDMQAHGDTSAMLPLARGLFHWLGSIKASSAQVASVLLWRDHEHNDIYREEAISVVEGLIFASQNSRLFAWFYNRLVENRKACGGRVSQFFERSVKIYFGRFGSAVAYTSSNGSVCIAFATTAAENIDTATCAILDYGGRNWAGWTTPLLVRKKSPDFVRIGIVTPVAPEWRASTIEDKTIYLKGQ
ncbi:hypothetical protein M427DRAFT_148228 [Gonapodya prolifera JEL478]|uniref:Heterokaryon incompatibility domain-containing protein n=1 Tax=Gonapodya prolifera (strain JEL478) TaxID=1344416 RepID=A0A139A270_GONPJ|nr:hypothetical protein M427DRAFT_148228 [Gonapodya prolifera JEL478]|eukprot:KXS10834.1 hypothetical protein M427DRAFT_148228 [Gonapodya prolifera JEL478]